MYLTTSYGTKIDAMSRNLIELLQASNKNFVTLTVFMVLFVFCLILFLEFLFLYNILSLKVTSNIFLLFCLSLKKAFLKIEKIFHFTSKKIFCT